MQYARVNPRHDSCCKAQLTFGRLAAGSLGLPVGTAGGGTTSGPPTLRCCVSLESATRRRVEVQQQTMTTANGVRRGQTAVLEPCATARAWRRLVRRLPRSQISSKLRLRIRTPCLRQLRKPQRNLSGHLSGCHRGICPRSKQGAGGGGQGLQRTSFMPSEQWPSEQWPSEQLPSEQWPSEQWRWRPRSIKATNYPH